jgi:hypothetical protein
MHKLISGIVEFRERQLPGYAERFRDPHNCTELVLHRPEPAAGILGRVPVDVEL